MIAYGVFSTGAAGPRVGALIDDGIVELSRLDSAFTAASLNPFLARGRTFWERTHEQVATLAADVAVEDAIMHLPIEVADFVDFYSSLEHATNAARILRPSNSNLAPNWRSMPVGYHARAGTWSCPVRRSAGRPASCCATAAGLCADGSTRCRGRVGVRGRFAVDAR